MVYGKRKKIIVYVWEEEGRGILIVGQQKTIQRECANQKIY